jgi:LPXTG-motif cell wall-anchored protein
LDIKGSFEVKGLPYGKYVLVETKAPAGYAMPTNPETKFVVDGTSYHKDPDSITVGTDPSDDVQLIDNRKLTIPQTGGFGMKAFTIIGVFLMIASIIYYKGPSKKLSQS